MLHELLLAMSGHSGNVFSPFPAEGPRTQRIEPDFPFVHPSEASGLNRLAQLGFKFNQIARFLSEQRHQGDFRTSTRENAKLFLSALVGSIEAHVLDPYREALAQAERTVLSSKLSGQQYGLLWIQKDFEQFETLFDYILGLVSELDSNPSAYHGARLLDLLYGNSITGIPEIMRLMIDLRGSCLAVFYRFLISWMAHGRLHDPFGEFFIYQNESRAQTAPGNATSAWFANYGIAEELVPTMLTQASCHKIMFVGKAVATIRHAASPKADLYLKEHASQTQHELKSLVCCAEFRGIEFSAVIERIHHRAASMLWEIVVLDQDLVNHLLVFKNYFLIGKGEIFTDFIESCEALRTQASQRLAKITSHDINNSFRRIVAQYVTESDGPHVHLTFRLLRNDESGGGFPSPFRDKLLGTPLQLDYHIQWPLTILFTNDDIQKYNSILSFLLILRRTQMRLQKVWSLDNYFHRRISRTASPANTTIINPQWWHLRRSMLFFVDAIWSYVQMDILDTNFQEMITRLSRCNSSYSNIDRRSGSLAINTAVDGADDELRLDRPPTALSQINFEEIHRAHADFLTAVVRGTFLEPVMLRLVGGTIVEILDMCEKYCGVLDREIKSSYPCDKPQASRSAFAESATVAQLALEFDSKVAFLFRTFSGVRNSSPQATCLGQLLLRIDYNRWFSLSREP
ncbi:gamma-tubulin complex component protein [Polychytrium aggregatum]|uniref:gamma-tubulin complex component protein n=1 Tax=Polychytrium aggregatum TaxID=110093 RepID=UPI0022FEDABA|nr:gamma-tubulin complex component protein [Polychytrium aggregatum]KAI9202458.1 gamma-tubulin complex component protein [Polychytrium aggregatum]